MTIRDFVLVGLLGAAGGAGVLTTNIFHTLIPIPGLGAMLFMPLSAICLIVARHRVRHPVSAGMTKTVQHLVMFFLPGGPPTAHNPLIAPLMILDGFILDGLYRLYPVDLAKARWQSGVLVALSGLAGSLLQVGILAIFMGTDQFVLANGWKPFVALFLGLHSFLRFLGGMIGSWILASLPERPN